MIDEARLVKIDRRVALCSPFEAYTTSRGGVVVINGPFPLSEALAIQEFLNHARQDVPDLVAEVRRLRASVQAPTGHRPHIPLLKVARTQVYLTPAMVKLLAGCRRATLTVEDGRPVLRSDANGFIVSRPGASGAITANPVIRLANEVLGTGSAWLMERDAANDCWRWRRYHDEH